MHQAQTRPKGAAFVFHDEIWTYERLATEAGRLARELSARGIGPGDRVALHMMNRPEMLVAYYACFKLGAIVAPLRTAFKFAELAPLLQRLKPALYTGEIGLYDNVAPVDASILTPDRRFVVDATFEDHGVQPWETLLQTAANRENLSIAPASYKPAVLISTSGSTGEPKFVVHTPETLAESADLLLKHWGLSDDDVVVMPLPMAHMSGLIIFLANIAGCCDLLHLASSGFKLPVSARTWKFQ
jgi:acyl-CoA synthetase (AMP-forming)/AMP-acid ligase II